MYMSMCIYIYIKELSHSVKANIISSGSPWICISMKYVSNNVMDFNNIYVLYFVHFRYGGPFAGGYVGLKLLVQQGLT